MLRLFSRDEYKKLFTRASVKSVIDNPIKFFTVLAIVVGFFFVVTNPPGFGLDERAHFMRTYLVSHGDFFPNKVGAFLPINLVQFVGSSTADLLDNDTTSFFVSRHDTDMGRYSSFFKEPFSAEKVNDVSTNSQLLASNAYSPVGYLHMALVTKVAQFLGMPMIYSMYFSRIINLIIYILIIILAIKVIPRYKWLIVAVALLPTAIYQASSMSLDPLVTALSFLVTAYAVRFWLGEKKTITKKQILIILASFIVIALIKTPYVGLLLLFLGLPSNRFESKKLSYIIKAGWLAGGFLAALSWVYINRAITPSLVLLQPGDANMREQLHFIFAHPISVIEALARTHYESIDHTLGSLFGRAGDRQVGLPNAFMYIFFVLGAGLSALVGSRVKVQTLTKRDSRIFNVLLVATIVGVISLVSVTLYITFTPVGATSIQGIQGRYFLPILPVVIICIHRLAGFKESNSPRILNVVRVSVATFLILTAYIFYLVNF